MPPPNTLWIKTLQENGYMKKGGKSLAKASTKQKSALKKAYAQKKCTTTGRWNQDKVIKQCSVLERLANRDFWEGPDASPASVMKSDCLRALVPLMPNDKAREQLKDLVATKKPSEVALFCKGQARLNKC